MAQMEVFDQLLLLQKAEKNALTLSSLLMHNKNNAVVDPLLWPKEDKMIQLYRYM